jgi:PTH1 family peptidyl-tRNA hydrolase
MKLIIGLGNPGLKYRHTWHNVGWRYLDHYAKEQKLTWKKSAKFTAEIAETTVAGENVWLVKPQLFYNESGRVVRAMVDFYHLTPADILVISDDLNLPLGTVRVRSEGSDGGNNGLKSITNHLGDQFMRVRVGTKNSKRESLPNDIDFVLSKVSKVEQAQLVQVFPHIDQAVSEFTAGKLSNTSHSLTND